MSDTKPKAKAKNNPYFPYYPNDHLNDLNLKGCHAAAKGIWWDMVSLMAQGEPWGHLRIAPGSKKLFPTPAAANPQGSWVGGPTPDPTRKSVGGPSKKMKGTLTLEFKATLARQHHSLSEDGSLEPDLARIIGQDPELVEWAIAQLEHRGVFSRTATGIIYCRRMVRYAEHKAEQAAHGSQGGKKTQQWRRNHARQGVGGATPDPTQKNQGGPTPDPSKKSKGGLPPNTNTSTSSKDITPTPQPPAPRGRGLSDEDIEQAVKTRRAGK